MTKIIKQLTGIDVLEFLRENNRINVQNVVKKGYTKYLKMQSFVILVTKTIILMIVLIYTFNKKNMLIKYKNYTIENDRTGYILNIFGIVKDKKSERFGMEYIVDTFYPATIESAINRIIKNEVSKKDIISLDSFINEYKKETSKIKDLFK